MSRDCIDLRDLAKELDELTERADDVDGDGIDGDELGRLHDLRNLAEELGGDLHLAARDEPMLIPDGRAFEDHARELAEDCGMIPSDAKWPCTCIDWEQAAEELQQDYTSYEFDGETYWRRS